MNGQGSRNARLCARLGKMARGRVVATSSCVGERVTSEAYERKRRAKLGARTGQIRYIQRISHRTARSNNLKRGFLVQTTTCDPSCSRFCHICHRTVNALSAAAGLGWSTIRLLAVLCPSSLVTSSCPRKTRTVASPSSLVSDAYWSCLARHPKNQSNLGRPAYLFLRLSSSFSRDHLLLFLPSLSSFGILN